MMNATDLDAPVNEANSQSQGQTVQRASSFWQRNWPRAFLLLSLVVVVLTFVGIILNFIKIVIKPNVTLLNIYCLLFSLLAFSAEMRQFQWFRKISYVWIKYVYFLTYYKPRGIFYILFGLLLLGNMAILYVAGAVAMIVGIVMLLTSFLVGLPVFDDPEEQRREQEEARRYYEGKNAKPAAFLVKHLGVKEQTSTAEPAAAGASQAPQQQQYQPPTLPLREGDAGASTSPTMKNSGTSSPGVPANRSTTSVERADSAQAIGAAVFGSGSAAATTTGRQQSTGFTGESQLRRDFAAAMDGDGSPR